MFFRKSKSAELGQDTEILPSVMPRRMSLEERKAFRRDMIDHVIRDSLQELEIGTGMYRCRVMPVDVRHHRFVAMMDLSQEFQFPTNLQTWTFQDIEVELKKQAVKRFGLRLEGIYWRVNESNTPAVQSPRRSPQGDSVPGAPLTGSLPISQGDSSRLVSEEERRALLDAIRHDPEHHNVHVGNWEYQTDLSAMDEPALPENRAGQKRGKHKP